MQIKEVDAKRELQVLASLVYNDVVLAAVANLIDKFSFQSRYSLKIAEKCVRHFNKYRKAPKQQINDYIEVQISNSDNDGETKALQRILTSLEDLRKSVNGKSCNHKYWIDKTREYLTHTKYSSLLREAVDASENGDLEKTEILVKQLQRVPSSGNGINNSWCDPISDKKIIERTLKLESEPIMKYQGALGKFFDTQLSRGNFLAFQGPEKSMKSFWMQEICFKALKSQLKVMFIGIGDMSLEQYNRRFYARLAYRPWHKTFYDYPKSWKAGSGNIHLPKLEKRHSDARITQKEIEAAAKKFAEKYLGSEKIGKFLKMQIVAEISIEQIDNWIRECQDLESWTPDVIVIDYADRINAPKGINDKIAQIDHNWTRLRAIALEQNCLMVTATQSRRSSYGGHAQTRDDVSDSKGKTALVTGLIGISANKEEYTHNVRRLNWIVCREHTKRSQVSVAACPAVGHPAVLSL